jgi:hypothetical protein
LTLKKSDSAKDCVPIGKIFCVEQKLQSLRMEKALCRTKIVLVEKAKNFRNRNFENCKARSEAKK